MTAATGLRWFDRAEVERRLDLAACIDAVERAFRLLGERRATPPRVLSLHVDGGAFHVKAGVMEMERLYFAAKVNGNFPGNPTQHALPTIQGVIVLADARDGRPLAIMDSIAITTLRTGAATAVAARRLARPDSHVAAIIGCGVQGRIQLAALRAVLPIERVVAFDRDAGRADRFADELGSTTGLVVQRATSIENAVASGDIVVTCTPARAPILHVGSARPGTFIAAVGADHPEKHEIDPRLMASCKVVVDDLEQCASLGDLHHAIAAGAMSQDDVHAELGEIVAERKPGRTSGDEITLFDSTGIAIQDVAAAATVFERATRAGAGIRLALEVEA